MTRSHRASPPGGLLERRDRRPSLRERLTASACSEPVPGRGLAGFGQRHELDTAEPAIHAAPADHEPLYPGPAAGLSDQQLESLAVLSLCRPGPSVLTSRCVNLMSSSYHRNYHILGGVRQGSWWTVMDRHGRQSGQILPFLLGICATTTIRDGPCASAVARSLRSSTDGNDGPRNRDLTGRRAGLSTPWNGARMARMIPAIAAPEAPASERRPGGCRGRRRRADRRRGAAGVPVPGAAAVSLRESPQGPVGFTQGALAEPAPSACYSHGWISTGRSAR